MDTKLYMSKAKRDEEYKRLKAQGKNVFRYVGRNKLLHPMYVEDYPRAIEDSEKGFGNMMYKTYFSRLYILNIKD